MKKNILFIIGTTIFLIAFIIILYTQDNDRVIFENDNSSNRVVSNNALTMMYETSVGSGEYMFNYDNQWLTDEYYVFNEELSKCENGSRLTWDDENKKVIMQANTSDKCYVYFDDTGLGSFYYYDNAGSHFIEMFIEIPDYLSYLQDRIVSYHYSIDGGQSFEISNESTYEFSGLTEDSEYELCYYLTLDNGKTVGKECYFTYTSTPYYITDYIIDNVYTGVDGENNLYYHDGQGTYINANQEARDNSYRYSGANPNNYLCLGTYEEPCPEDNLYRIIGIFDNYGNLELKIIKNSSIGSCLLDDNCYTLVETYLENTFNNEWDYVYYSTGNNLCDYDAPPNFDDNFNIVSFPYEAYSVYSFYGTEYGSRCNYSSYYDYVMLVSDYGYSVDPSYWKTALTDYNLSINYNWLYNGINEHTADHSSNPPNEHFEIGTNGSIDLTYQNKSRQIRPTLFLNYDVEYSSGNGTKDNPYRILKYY